MSYTLRDLPLPVKVVATVFLLAVGAGYTSAMVQLHMQDSKSGKPMPTVDDVIRKYTGKKKFDPNAPVAAPVTRLEALITAPDTMPICGASMAAAFTTQDPAAGPLKFANAVRGQLPERVAEVKAERKGEQAVFKLWINTADEDRKAAYAADKFVPPAGQMPKAVTPLLTDGNAVKIKTLIDARCVNCHSAGGEKENEPLDTYDGLLKHMAVTAPPPAGDWVKVEEPISTTKLTQSTHAHLLSFAMLFSLTGLVFAMSSYPTGLRCVLGPWVVVAVFADVSLWWLARLCSDWGPYFAMGIIGTGMIAGAGLFGQIVLSLFNMYGRVGKLVIAGILVGGGGIMGLMWLNVFAPALREKESAVRKEEPKKNDKPVDPPKKPEDKKPEDKKPEDKKPEDKKAEDKPRPPSNELDRLLTLPARDATGQLIPPADVQFNGQEKGSMAAALFEKEKDKAFKKMIEDAGTPQAAKDKLRSERQAELGALGAWARTGESSRKSAYDADRFDGPADQVSPDFAADGKVKIRSLIGARCATCHSGEGKQADYPLDTYEGLSVYLKPLAAEPPMPAPAPAPAPPVPPPVPKAIDAIPPAKDD